MQAVQRKKRLEPLKGAWEYQRLGEDPKNPVSGEIKAIFEHVARLDGEPVPSVRLRDPHIIAYTREEVLDHLKRPDVSPIPPRLLYVAVRAFDCEFPKATVTTESEPSYQKPPVGKYPFRRGL